MHFLLQNAEVLVRECAHHFRVHGKVEGVEQLEVLPFNLCAGNGELI